MPAYRAQITPAGRGRRGKADPNRTEPQKRQAMTWAQRLKRVFRIDIETCEHCGGESIEQGGQTESGLRFFGEIDRVLIRP